MPGGGSSRSGGDYFASAARVRAVSQHGLKEVLRQGIVELGVELSPAQSDQLITLLDSYSNGIRASTSSGAASLRLPWRDIFTIASVYCAYWI